MRFVNTKSKTKKTVNNISKKVYNNSTTPTETQYLAGYQYISNVLQFFPTAEGYVNNTVVSGINQYSYVYNYTDHLGNIRLSYKKNGTTLQILEENNYYPFGLKHTYYNTTNAQPNYKYKYNGKEYQDELGLNFYDYGARNYDASIGRFFNMDRFSEKYYDKSTYQYAGNNPIYFIDVKGDSLWIKHNGNNILYQNGKLLNRNGSNYVGIGVKVKRDGTIKIKDKYVKKIIKNLEKLVSKNKGKEMLEEIQNSSSNIYISKGDTDNGYTPASNTINWDPSNNKGGLDVNGKVSRPSFIGLGHELAHALDDLRGSLDRSIDQDFGFVKAEIFATHIENQLREEHGLALRAYYSYDPQTMKGIGSLIQDGTKRSTYYPNYEYGNYITEELHPIQPLHLNDIVKPTVNIVR